MVIIVVLGGLCVCVCVCVCVSGDVSVVWCGRAGCSYFRAGVCGVDRSRGGRGSRPSPVLYKYKRAPLFQINHIHRILPLLS